MSSTESRSGFRLPWSSDRAHESQPADVATEPAADTADEPAGTNIAWPDSDYNARLGVTPTQPRPADDLTVDPAGSATEPVAADDPAASAPQEPAMVDTAPIPPAPAVVRKPSKLVADLSAAIRATAEAARDEALSKVDADVAAVVGGIRAGAKEGEVALKHRSDEDVAEIREWSKAEIARIKEETEARIEARKARLADEIATHAAEIEIRVGAIEGLANAYRGDMAAYSDRLVHEDDPARLATMAESMPEPPVFAELASVDIEDLPEPPAEAVVDAPANAGVDDAWAAAASDADDAAVADPDDHAGAATASGVADEAAAVAEAAWAATEPETGADTLTGTEAEPETVVEAEQTTATDNPWGAPTPWAGPDQDGGAAELSDGAGDDVPRWAAGETPDGFPEPVEGGDPVDRGAIMAALEAAAEAVVAAEAAAESADQAEAAADVAETAAELVVGRAGGADDLDPEAQAAFSARIDAGGYDTESYTDRLASLMPGHETPEDDGAPRTSSVVVSGLVSVASIASFKRHLGRIPGVDAVAVASGPDGEFVFNVTHRADVSFRDAIPTMPGFAARVTSTGDGIVTVSARDPEAEG